MKAHLPDALDAHIHAEAEEHGVMRHTEATQLEGLPAAHQGIADRDGSDICSAVTKGKLRGASSHTLDKPLPQCRIDHAACCSEFMAAPQACGPEAIWRSNQLQNRPLHAATTSSNQHAC